MKRSWTEILCLVAGVLLVLLGGGLAFGGGWLIALGGSFFYFLAGLAMVATGVGVFLRRAWAAPVAFGLLAVSVVWAIWEVGLDFWQLVPRVVVFLVIAIGVAAVTPLLRRKDGEARALKPRQAGILSAVLGLAFVAVIVGMFQPHAEIAARGGAVQASNPSAGQGQGDDWNHFGRDLGGNRFAPFTQINKQNVKDLKVAWQFRTGDLAIDGAEYQVTPIKIKDTLYLCTPRSQVIALNAADGTQKWHFKPDLRENAGQGDGGKGWQRCRGVSYVETADVTACPARIMLTTIDAKLYALDARTGRPCPGFGENGQSYVNLLNNLGPRGLGNYYPTAAPLVAGDVVVVGGLVGDNDTVGQPSGVTRAYDVRTGAPRWAWDPAEPKRGRPLTGDEVYESQTPNFWGTAAYDPQLNLIYIPTGNQTPDFWNGDRLRASDEYNSSIVAIDAATGVDRWHFRTANRDMFDYDVSSQPILYDMPDGKGGITPTVVQLTKRGEVFVLDRRNGQPVVPVTQRPVPPSTVPGMKPAPTQPFSAISVGVDNMTERDAWGGTIFDQLYCRIQFKRMRWEGPYTPMVENDWTLIWPGYYGGFNWGGGSLDPTTGVLYVNDIRMAMIGRFLNREKAKTMGLKPSNEGEYSQMLGTPYGAERAMWLSPLGTPCFKPPFGSMTAIDLKTQAKLWSVPVGTIADAPVKGITPHVPIPIGMPTMGGPINTAGGLVFFHGSLDWALRAFDRDTGKVLWQSRLPVGGQGAPMTYMENGKQYVVVVAGGATRTGTNDNRGDYVIAYALPSA